MARIRSDLKQMYELLESSERPVYALDDERKIIYCNEACLRWLSVSRAELMGRRCNYHAQPESSNEVTQWLGPSPRALLGDIDEQRVVTRDAKGDLVTHEVHFLPLGAAATLAIATVSEGAAHPPPPGHETASDLHQQLQQAVATSRDQYRLDPWVGEGIAMRRVQEKVRIAVASQAGVALVGPCGSGREFLARAIHASQSGDLLPLLPLSAPLLDAELLQATLVAYLQRFSDEDAAHPPTLLLQDADRLAPAVQLELLGFTRLPTISLRILCTVNESLLELAAAGQFDAELASRLSCFEIELPSLADRREDIPLLSQRIIERRNIGNGKQLEGCATEVLDRLGAMPWPGNLDELVEVLESAWTSADGPLIEMEDLPERVQLVSSAAEYPAPLEEWIELDVFLAEVERELISRALRQSQGNKAQAARLLGLQRSRLLRRMSQLDIESWDVRNGPAEGQPHPKSPE